MAKNAVRYIKCLQLFPVPFFYQAGWAEVGDARIYAASRFTLFSNRLRPSTIHGRPPLTSPSVVHGASRRTDVRRSSLNQSRELSIYLWILSALCSTNFSILWMFFSGLASLSSGGKTLRSVVFKVGIVNALQIVMRIGCIRNVACPVFISIKIGSSECFLYSLLKFVDVPLPPFFAYTIFYGRVRRKEAKTWTF